MKFTDNSILSPSPGSRIFLATASGILLALSYPDFNLSILGWFCFVPLLVSLENSGYRFSYCLGLLTGIAGMCLGFQWISEWALNALEVSWPWNWLFVVFYAFCFGQVFGVIAILYRWLSDFNDFIQPFLFPLVLVAVFSVFPMIFHFHLGDGQWKFLTAMQPVEYTGIYGLDFVMALTSATLFLVIARQKTGWHWISITCAMLLILAWLSGGYCLLQNWDREMKQWSTRQIGIVQPNRPTTLSRPRPEKGFSREYPLEMQLTEELAERGAEIVVWPEGHFFGYTFWQSVRDAFHEKTAALEISLLFHDSTYRLSDGKKRYYNSILFLDKGGLVSVYDKIKLVPFSEYLPFFNSFPLFDWILGDYLDNLTPGNENTIFETDGIRLVPRICYEPLYPGFVAESIGSDAGGKLILVQSQDGWFGKSSQPFQHLTVTTIRAVENRVPLVHVIQNGPSAVIQPNGRLSFISKAFTRGAWVVPVPYHNEKGGSFFSRHPGLFINSVRGLLGLLLLISLFRLKFNGLKH